MYISLSCHINNDHVVLSLFNKHSCSYDNWNTKHWPYNTYFKELALAASWSKNSFFKILLITYKILNGQSTIQEYHPSKTLRSSTRSLLCILLLSASSYGGRAFSAAAPELWNSIPEYIKRAETVEPFKTRLQTFLFQKHYC